MTAGIVHGHGAMPTIAPIGSNVAFAKRHISVVSPITTPIRLKSAAVPFPLSSSSVARGPARDAAYAVSMGLVRRFLHPPARTPDPDRTVELAWLPLWQAHLVAAELWERDVPCAIVEDHTSQLLVQAREPMARLFVIEPRLTVATAIVTELIGQAPARLHH